MTQPVTFPLVPESFPETFTSKLIGIGASFLYDVLMLYSSLLLRPLVTPAGS
ncbi:MAG: hypothetical protein K0U98_05720 [Deltaproteobacteria bacterium]|nr:hypothetical protein [Deltaproteobacteria bacterium]